MSRHLTLSLATIAMLAACGPVAGTAPADRLVDVTGPIVATRSLLAAAPVIPNALDRLDHIDVYLKRSNEASWPALPTGTLQARNKENPTGRSFGPVKFQNLPAKKTFNVMLRAFTDAAGLNDVTAAANGYADSITTFDTIGAGDTADASVTVSDGFKLRLKNVSYGNGKADGTLSVTPGFTAATAGLDIAVPDSNVPTFGDLNGALFMYDPVDESTVTFDATNIYFDFPGEHGRGPYDPEASSVTVTSDMGNTFTFEVTTTGDLVLVGSLVVYYRIH